MTALRCWLGLCIVLVPLPGYTRPAGALTVVVSNAPKATAKAALTLDGARWAAIKGRPLRLSHTPPLHAGGPHDDGSRPEATVQMLALDTGQWAVRLSWTDATRNHGAPSRRVADGGERRIYKRHSEGVGRFSDAACVMIPKQRGARKSYPSLMMGDAKTVVELFYWRAGAGFSHLVARGRASTKRTAKQVRGKAQYKEGVWTAVFIIPALDAGTPVAFALWDGKKRHRDGLKYFSLWYEVKP
jgi:hypothetical protein